MSLRSFVKSLRLSRGERMAFFEGKKMPRALLVELWDAGLAVTPGRPIAPMRVKLFLERVDGLATHPHTDAGVKSLIEHVRAELSILFS